jgi:hypothetical protein
MDEILAALILLFSEVNKTGKASQSYAAQVTVSLNTEHSGFS